jgi:hypothetical protein
MARGASGRTPLETDEDRMKAITLTQPWASLTMSRRPSGRFAKLFETRSWATGHKGELAIHAAKGFPKEARALCEDEPFRTALLEGGFKSWRDLPTSAVLGTVNLVRCVPGQMAMRSVLFEEDEGAFGFFDAPERIAWQMTDQRPFQAPIPAKGALSVWEWDHPPIRTREEMRLTALAVLKAEAEALEVQLSALANEAYKHGDKHAFWLMEACRKQINENDYDKTTTQKSLMGPASEWIQKS